ncbi:ATP-dependent RNA helicase, partial [Vibrio sp. 665]|nr:ATP-dependent RNA helicase [Vibrio sp. 665]
LQGGEAAEALEQEEPLGCDASLMIRLVRGEQLPAVIVDASVLEEAQGLAKQMRDVFELPQLEVASRYRRDPLTQAIAALHPELVFVRRERRRDALGNGSMEMVVGRNSRFPDKSEAALVLDSHSVPGRGVKQTLNLASVMMPISLELIKTLELGEWHQGEVAIQSIADMIEQEMLLPGFAPLRKQQIQHWKIYNSLGLNTELVDKKVIDELCFSTWLTEQLATLGVESVDDIELFEA